MNVIELKELEDILKEYMPNGLVWDLMPLIRQKTFYLKENKGGCEIKMDNIDWLDIVCKYDNKCCNNCIRKGICKYETK